MTLIESDPEGLDFLLEHNGYRFKVVGRFSGDGRLILEPTHGWDELSVAVNQDPESLYEQIDETIYNAMPEVFDEHS